RSTDFLSSYTLLEEVLAQPEGSFQRDDTILRFEFAYELSWKAIKLWLETRDITALSPKDGLREAIQLGLLTDGNGWSPLHQMRNLTSQTYDEAQAAKVYNFMQREGVQLFAELAREAQAWSR
ncbi:conserved hypothetical protein, partial [Ricinus communis]